MQIAVEIFVAQPWQNHEEGGTQKKETARRGWSIQNQMIKN